MWPIVNMSEEDRATNTGNMHKKCGKDRECGSGDILADRQTDRHTHHNTSQPVAWMKLWTQETKARFSRYTSYDIRSGNGQGLFWCRRVINLSLTYLDIYPVTCSHGTHTGVNAAMNHAAKSVAWQPTTCKEHSVHIVIISCPRCSDFTQPMMWFINGRWLIAHEAYEDALWEVHNDPHTTVRFSLKASTGYTKGMEKELAPPCRLPLVTANWSY